MVKIEGLRVAVMALLPKRQRLLPAIQQPTGVRVYDEDGALIMEDAPKLARLITRGARQHARCPSGWHRVSPQGELMTCAITAAYTAVFGSAPAPASQMVWRLNQHLGYDLTKVKRRNPVTRKRQSVMKIIMSLNDDHGWEREVIAEWARSERL